MWWFSTAEGLCPCHGMFRISWLRSNCYKKKLKQKNNWTWYTVESIGCCTWSLREKLESGRFTESGRRYTWLVSTVPVPTLYILTSSSTLVSSSSSPFKSLMYDLNVCKPQHQYHEPQIVKLLRIRDVTKNSTMTIHQELVTLNRKTSTMEWKCQQWLSMIISSPVSVSTLWFTGETWLFPQEIFNNTIYQEHKQQISDRWEFSQQRRRHAPPLSVQWMFIVSFAWELFNFCRKQ